MSTEETTTTVVTDIGTPPTTEVCTTGVTNELGGCEPVGTEFNEPATVYPPTIPPVRLTTTTEAVVTVPPDLPSTGNDAMDVSVFGGIVLVIGAFLVVVARRRSWT